MDATTKRDLRCLEMECRIALIVLQFIKDHPEQFNGITVDDNLTDFLFACGLSLFRNHDLGRYPVWQIVDNLEYINVCSFRDDVFQSFDDERLSKIIHDHLLKRQSVPQNNPEGHGDYAKTN